MAIAHVCNQCGFDLARIRARLEPRYRLPLVMCPKCSTAYVRRPHPIFAGFKQLRRIDCALTILLLQTILILAFAGATLLSVFALTMLMFERPQMRAADVPWILLYSLTVLPLLTGAWLTSSFSHIKWWRVWIGWFCFMLIPIAAIGWGLAVSGEFVMGEIFEVKASSQMIGWIDVAISVALFCIAAAAPLAAIMALSFVGIPLGRLILWLFGLMIKARWRWRRRNVRKWRNA